ncbi:hypothetical protein Tco_0337162 [Tanacetum coccineum]
MDRLSKRKFGIVCHGKVVRIPLKGDEILRVHGERTQGVVKTLMNTKVVKFRVDLVPGATLVAKSLYRLAPLEMQELSEQLQELQDKELELLRKEKLYAKVTSVRHKYEYETRYHPGKANVVIEALRGKEQVKPSLRYLSENEIESPWILSVNFQDAVESVTGAIRFEYCLASSSGWKKSPVLWVEIGKSSLIGHELVQETTDKFEVGDCVLLKVSPWKGVIRFGKRGKLAPRYVGPFEILERIGPIAYQLRLPEELSSVHDTFHVSNLKKCLADASLHVPLNEIKVDKTLRFVEEPVEIMDREIKKLKRSKIALVKVRWNSKRGSEFTWEREDHMKSKYPQLFVDHDVESAS